MVRLLNANNVDKVANILIKVMKFQELFTRVIEYNNPNKTPCIYAMWHGNQFCIYGLQNKAKVNVLISRSIDGEIISRAVEKLGFKVIRGSKGKKGAVEATMQIIEVLKKGEDCAIMIDGPKGPAHVVKDGIVKIARLANVPIVPVTWYSKNPSWIHFPSWDNMNTPILATNLVNIYGEPIFVKENDSDEEICKRIKQSLDELDKIAPKAFDEVYKFGIWKRKR